MSEVRRIVLLPLVAAVLCSGLAVGGCGSSSLQLSEEQVFESLRNSFARPAYLPSYRRCVADEFERLASPAQVDDLGGDSRSERVEAIAELLPRAEDACKRANPRIVDPAAATAELAPLRLNTGAAVERQIEEEGATAAEAACAKRRFRQLDDAEFIRYANATPDSQVDLAARILLPCFR